MHIYLYCDMLIFETHTITTFKFSFRLSILDLFLVYLDRVGYVAQAGFEPGILLLLPTKAEFTGRHKHSQLCIPIKTLKLPSIAISLNTPRGIIWLLTEGITFLLLWHSNITVYG